MADLEDLVARIRALPRPDRLRLAAELLERGKADVAEKIALEVLEELSALHLLGKGGVG